jgi:predicted dinucleotide-binding enzyme
LFDHVDDTNLADTREDEWVLMTCANDDRAYIYLNDLANVAGIADVGPGLMEYGKVRDLTSAEARQLASQR